jgi:hypothetical protein
MKQFLLMLCEQKWQLYQDGLINDAFLIISSQCLCLHFKSLVLNSLCHHFVPSFADTSSLLKSQLSQLRQAKA